MKFLAPLSLVFFALLPRLAFAQATEAELKKFKMPPPAAQIVQTKNFGFVGDYGYYLKPATAKFSLDGASINAFQFVKYSGVAGKHVWIMPGWNSSIPAASGGADACAHTHLSFGVWAKIGPSINLPFGPKLSGYQFMGGGSMSGVRDANGKCKHKVDNPLNQIDNHRFGWGKDYLDLDFRNNKLVTDIIVGVAAPTHGWGTCTLPAGQSFKACLEPAHINAWTLPN